MRIYRDTDRHAIRDLNVSTSLRGEFTTAIACELCRFDTRLESSRGQFRVAVISPESGLSRPCELYEEMAK